MPINIAVIGTGEFGRQHVKVFKQNEKAKLSMICDLNQHRAAEIAQQYDVPLWTGNSTDVFQNQSIDAVVIATAEETHFELTKQAVEHGKHVLLEKPVCLDPAVGEQLIQLVANTDRVVLPGHLLRYDASYSEVKRMLDSGEAGEIQSIKVKRNVPRARFALHARTHPVFMALSHDIDIILWLTNQNPRRVFALDKKTDPQVHHPDIFFGLLEMENGVVCQLETQWTLPDEYGQYLDVELEIMTTTGHICLKYPGNQLKVMNHGALSHPDVTLWPEIHGKSAGALVNEIDSFLDLISGKRQKPVVTVEEAVRGIKIGHYLIQSAEEKREIRPEV